MGMNWGKYFKYVSSPMSVADAVRGRNPAAVPWRYGKDPKGPAGPPELDASAALANLTREQWDTYLEQYVPQENRLIDYATDASAPTDAAAQAQYGVQGAFSRQQEATDRRMAGMGMTLNADEAASAQKQTGLAGALASVNAANNAATATVQRQQGILGNPAPAVPKGTM
jgi:hypothetical protein